jgi:uncharacterized protein (TIGR00661 family)
MGHAIRSRVVLDHLVTQGHEIEIMASGRATDFLSKRFADVNRIHGLHMIYEENRVRKGKTLWSNVLAGAMGVPKNIAAYFELISSFNPEVVISDFESWTYLYAKAHRVPVVSIDNMQIINRCVIPPTVIEGYETDFQIAKAFVKGKLPYCDEYLITTFFRPEIRKPKTRLFPPILRPEILSAARVKGDHLLVYQTAEGNDALLETLARTGLPCRIYGMRRDLKEDAQEANLLFRPFSEAGFIADLASSRGVIAGGGFTLMGECVYLHKPMLSVPIGGQFEQILNGRYLEQKGYGAMAPNLDDPQTVFDFVEKLPRFEAALAGYEQNGNKLLLDALDGVLDRAEAGIL